MYCSVSAAAALPYCSTLRFTRKLLQLSPDAGMYFARNLHLRTLLS
jgi:hypothetical protein